MTQLIGTPLIRTVTALLILLAALAAAKTPALPTMQFPPWVAVALGAGSLFCFVHSFHSVFERWMALAEKMNKVSTAVLFGAVYLLVLPLFVPAVWIVDALGMRKARAKSFWRERKAKPLSLQSLRRMS